jgi:hypothetical protein
MKYVLGTAAIVAAAFVLVVLGGLAAGGAPGW